VNIYKKIEVTQIKNFKTIFCFLYVKIIVLHIFQLLLPIMLRACPFQLPSNWPVHGIIFSGEKLKKEAGGHQWINFHHLYSHSWHDVTRNIKRLDHLIYNWLTAHVRLMYVLPRQEIYGKQNWIFLFQIIFYIIKLF
jgi:hypothetical protein